MRIALVTYEGAPGLDPDDHVLVRAFAELGHQATPAVWSDPAVAWGTFDLALLRSTWDYFHRRDEFLAWSERAGAATTLLHPPRFLRWNSDKHYLAELADAGVPTVPTVWRRAGESVNLDAIAREQGWSSLLVKPAVSGNAFGTLRIVPTERATAQREVDELAKTRDLLVQPYLSRVEAEGERSLLYFDGVFSHALCKRPVPGDFRVQETFGGVATAYPPTAAERDIAERTLRVGAQAAGMDTLLYARIDLLYDADGPRLIELEAIEPSLYFATAAADAPLRLCRAALARVR